MREEVDVESVVKKLLKLGASDAIATLIITNSTQLKFVNNKIATIKNKRNVWLEIFIALQKRLSIASTSVLSKVPLEKFLVRMIKVAKTLTPKEDYYGIAKGPFKYKSIRNFYDKKAEDFSEASEILADAIDVALLNGAKRCSGVLEWGILREKLASSEQIFAHQKMSHFNFSIRSFVKEDSSSHCISASRIFKKFCPETAAEESSLIARESINPLQGKEGTYDILFHPMAIAELLSSMNYAFSAFDVDVGNSFLLGKLGEVVANERITIYDDGTLENGIASTIFDREGRPTQRTILILKGVLKNYLHNTSTAKKFKMKPTANAGILVPVSHNTVIQKGDFTFEELLQQVKKGIYITNLWYTRLTNYRIGEFSSLPRDAMFEIKSGKIVRPIKNLRLVSSFPLLLKNTIATTKRRKQIHSWEAEAVLTGWWLCKNLQLTKPK